MNRAQTMLFSQIAKQAIYVARRHNVC